jgi:transposase
MHARRKFESAAIDGAKAGKTIASQVMEIYKKIYDYEEQLANARPEQKTEARGKYQRPLFIQIKELSQKHRNTVSNKSKLGIALSYFENEYEYLTRYLDDGHIGPDNGMVERTIRKFAIGRNNWLFADTPEGAEASALLYSLVITAKVNGVNPYAALTKILTHVPLAKSIEDYDRLADLILAP